MAHMSMQEKCIENQRRNNMQQIVSSRKKEGRYLYVNNSRIEM